MGEKGSMRADPRPSPLFFTRKDGHFGVIDDSGWKNGQSVFSNYFMFSLHKGREDF